ncbi:hypothetical protein J2S74_000912 [Evansella vedderi]|uniref:Uncharacterized protein n=1 Tax=Evansella vedderi TaxID=38282 RepID=A0ABT9ZTP9_9BACI|nr:hypothetical protein [Evansella vedderi]MDQ0253540.1 hypothetical protein [Evansella vedderi]
MVNVTVHQIQINGVPYVVKAPRTVQSRGEAGINIKRLPIVTMIR